MAGTTLDLHTSYIDVTCMFGTPQHCIAAMSISSVDFQTPDDVQITSYDGNYVMVDCWVDLLWNVLGFAVGYVCGILSALRSHFCGIFSALRSHMLVEYFRLCGCIFSGI